MGTNPVVLVRGARQLLTLRGPGEARRGPLLQELRIIPDGALLIRNGIIEDVGPSRRIERLGAARDALEIDVSGRVVMPGFVDSMVRLVFRHACTENPVALERALKAESRHSIEPRCRTLLADMARHGTCTVEAETGFAHDQAVELKALRT